MIDTNNFFKNNNTLDRLVLRPLSHIMGNWELTWDREGNEYEAEEDSYAERLNHLISELSQIDPPKKYHDHEDRLAEYVQSNLNWKIKKIGNRWVGETYGAILEQGGFSDIDQENLLSAAAGRIKAATDRGQLCFDDMELSHQAILADVLAIILYFRSDDVVAGG